MNDESAPIETRRVAVRSLANLATGAEYLVHQSTQGAIPAELSQAVAVDMHQLPWDDLRAQANELYPLPPSKDNKPIASIRRTDST